MSIRHRAAVTAACVAGAVSVSAWLASPAIALPDGRAYEQVSPAEKYGYGVGGNADAVVGLQAAADGNIVSYRGINPLPPSETGSQAAFRADRGDAAWNTSSLLPPPGPRQIGQGLPGLDAILRLTTPDQRTTVYWDNTTEPWGSLNIRRADGSTQRIAEASAGLPGGASLAGGAPAQAWAAGISDDGRRVVFASNQRLVPGLPPTVNPLTDPDILYEWVDDGANGGAGTLRVVNRTDGEPLALLDRGAAELGGSSSQQNARAGGPRGLRHAISDGSDGHSRIFFQNPAPTTDTVLVGGPVYMREDGARTVEISAPEPGGAAATQRRYLDATPDGTRVFFWANTPLTDNAVAGGAIYRYDVTANAGSGDLVFLAAAPPVASAPPTAIASDDGSRLYYQKGPDVYLNEDGQDRLVLAGTTIIIGAFNGDPFGRPDGVAGTPAIRDDVCPSANVSVGDGRYFTFTGRAGGTQVYRYDAVSGVPAEMISVRGTADPERYDSLFAGVGCGQGGIPRPGSVRVMSDDGRYVFFDSSGSLVPGDVNGRIDAYRWRDDGDVALLSSGTAAANSGFVGADASGSNAFLVTDERLTPQDGDSSYDIYDARIGGGFPFAPATPPCLGDACQGSGPAPASAVTPGSSAYVGPGNAVEHPAAPRPSSDFSVLARRLRGSTLMVRLRVPQAGRVRVSGRRVRAVDQQVRAGRVSVPVKLARRARTALKAGKTFRIRVSVRYTPRVGRASSRLVTLRAKQQVRR